MLKNAQVINVMDTEETRIRQKLVKLAKHGLHNHHKSMIELQRRNQALV